MWAAEHRNLDAVQYLLSKGADPSIRDDVRIKGVSVSPGEVSFSVTCLLFVFLVVVVSCEIRS